MNYPKRIIKQGGKNVMNYPKRVIEEGEKDATIVQQIQGRLNELGCGPVAADGVFGKETAGAVRDFQGRHSDALGNPLVVDGRVGIRTWAILFDGSDEKDDVLSPLIVEVLKIARKEIGVCEVPPGSNSGPRVNEYLKCVGMRNKRGQESFLLSSKSLLGECNSPLLRPYWVSFMGI